MNHTCQFPIVHCCLLCCFWFYVFLSECIDYLQVIAFKYNMLSNSVAFEVSHVCVENNILFQVSVYCEDCNFFFLFIVNSNCLNICDASMSACLMLCGRDDRLECNTTAISGCMHEWIESYRYPLTSEVPPAMDGSL